MNLFRDLTADTAEPDISAKGYHTGRVADIMTQTMPKRFYKSVSFGSHQNGYEVLLDGVRTRSPGKADVFVKHPSIAQSLADEWQSQGEFMDFSKMPLTRIINSAIDGVEANQAKVADETAEYVASDLVCYRVAEPEQLAKRQSECWDPILEYAERQFGLKLTCSTGVMHVEQPKDAVGKVRNALAGFDSFELAAMHTATSICGSVLLALALASGEFSDDQVWTAAFVDESWNIEKWGEDEENTRIMSYKRAEFDAANVILSAGRTGKRPPSASSGD